MHGGAVTLARMFNQRPFTPDLILSTDMLDLTTFLALTRRDTAHVPSLLYMHENQLTYPLPSDGRTGPMRRQLGQRDQHYAFINYSSMLAADAVWFNSHHHAHSWFTAVPHFLKHFPEYNELDSVQQLQAKSQVMPVGIDFARLQRPSPTNPPNQPPLILWNQRWEYDKNPDAFLRALQAAAETGLPFRLALCGQQYGRRPPALHAITSQFSQQIVHVGHADPATYQQLLWQADLVISTAHHEFFGISILEALHCHTFPLLPNRLSYPEIIPTDLHLYCLYEDEPQLQQQLMWALTHPEQIRPIAAQLHTAVQTFAWPTIAPQYDHKAQLLACP